jgi:hypothetical protein
MILRCSDRATSDLLARINLRTGDLWRELDAVQEQIETAKEALDLERFDTLVTREREILAELDRIED